MDAERLIAAGRDALARGGTVPEILVEAWQAQILAQAIGARLALCGPVELRGEARALSETGGRGCAGLDCPTVRADGVRAARLTRVADERGTLLALNALLGEVGMALVGVACATDEEGLYWQCIEAIDAADESSDRVRGMLRRLAARDPERAERPPDVVRGRGDPIVERAELSALPEGPDLCTPDSVDSTAGP
ncbi:DUF6099 family protein [Streptomyces sp. MUM 178J]|uniref:DUF6099 family protein n=1 Tax=Streptomyces sp. MUM 178J TaxID=2791991 RepID=UPI001F046036|nr:DUF6099 family protein [Streptomyces sp. MUM 178J]WRQ80651.1 DUF6099 family protein [Streptomyces sp. MUM 178J]